MKHHMARRVAGAVADGQRLVSDLHRVAIVQPSCGRERFCGRKTEHCALLGQTVDPELIPGWGPMMGRERVRDSSPAPPA